jgi:thermostable 8-oxoguanine DNA glycosylase
MMSEEEIWEKHVKPYLLKLGFPEELISGYGKVPIRTSPFGVYYADGICYVMRGEERKPYLVVEIKRPGERLDHSQPEFYAFMVNSPFFAITNGEEWRWYLKGESQGKSIPLENLPIPSEITKTEITAPPFEISSEVQKFIASFEQKLDQDEAFCDKDDILRELRKKGCAGCPISDCLLGDATWHATAADTIRAILQKEDIMSMSSENLLKLFKSLEPWLMFKRPVMNVIMSAISESPQEVKEALCSLYDHRISIEDRFDKLRDIKGFGPFMASQLLASVDKKKYVVIESNVLEALRTLRIVEILPRPGRIQGRDYLYINEICNNLMKEGFNKHLELGLALVHDFLWHFERAYRITGDWMSF